MQEELHELFPARTALVLLAVLWLISVIGVLFFGGITVRSLFGSLFSAVLLWLSYLDLRDGMLYDVITLPFAVFGFVPVLAGLLSLREALIGGTLCGVLFYCLYIAARDGLGGGDVKLAAALGVWLGWESALIAVWIAFMFGGIAALFLLATGRKKRCDGIPFGPFLAVGGYLPLSRVRRSGSSIGELSCEARRNAGHGASQRACCSLCARYRICGGASGGAFTLCTCGG